MKVLFAQSEAIHGAYQDVGLDAPLINVAGQPSLLISSWAAGVC